MIDWSAARSHLSSHGWARLSRLLDPEQCRAMVELYDDEALFRSHILMARHGFGRGEYKYFAYPLPEPIAALRSSLYPQLAAVANEWNALLGVDRRFPLEHAEFLERCHAAGQTRPTPLLLRYGPGDYNCLHQDVYGEHVFPLQVTVLLSRPCVRLAGVELERGTGEAGAFQHGGTEGGDFARRESERGNVTGGDVEGGAFAGRESKRGEFERGDVEAGDVGDDLAGADFEGGEFVLVEQRPRMQSRPMVVPLRQGDAVVFAVNQRPVQGARGAYRVTLRHGVSELRSGRRHTLGIIFHDAT